MGRPPAIRRFTSPALFALFAACLVATSGPAFADAALGFGPINTSSPDVKAVCADTTLSLVGPRFLNQPDTNDNRTTNGVRVQTASGLYLSAYGGSGSDQADYFPALKTGQRVQACLTTLVLARRGGDSNRFCTNTSYRFYNYDLERTFVFDTNGCHA